MPPDRIVSLTDAYLPQRSLRAQTAPEIVARILRGVRRSGGGRGAAAAWLSEPGGGLGPASRANRGRGGRGPTDRPGHCGRRVTASTPPEAPPNRSARRDR